MAGRHHDTRHEPEWSARVQRRIVAPGEHDHRDLQQLRSYVERHSCDQVGNILEMRHLGTGQSGAAAFSIRVFVRDGVIKTALPF